MSDLVYLDGKLIPSELAVLPIDDRAVLFGDGAYETVRTYQGKTLRWEAHLERLHSTLAGIGIDLTLTDAQLTEGVQELIAANHADEARIRITVTGGRHQGAIRLKRPHPPRFIMQTTPLAPIPAEAYTQGVKVALSRYRVSHTSPLARLKTTPRLLHLMAKEEALEESAWEAVFIDEHDRILEGTASNIFFVVDNELWTPPLENALLAGITRELVLESASSAGITIRQEPVPLMMLPQASEIFITSTTAELLPVHEIGGTTLGVPGPVRRTLHQRYRDIVAAELKITLDPIP